MPSGYTRLAIESIPGNETNAPTLSTKKLFMPVITFGPQMGASPLDRNDELRNLDDTLPVVPDSYDPSYQFDVRGYPDTLGFLLTWMLGDPVVGTGNGVITDPDGAVIPTGAFRHVWTAPFGPSGASPLTAQADLAYKDQYVFYKGKGFALAELEFDFPEEGGMMVRASGPGAYLDTQSDPSLTPAYESITIRPFTRGGLTLPTWLTGSGTHEDFGLRFASPVESVRSMGIKSKWPDVVEKANEGPITVGFSLDQRQIDQDDIVALRDATGFPIKAKVESDSIIAGSYPYRLWAQGSNAQYTEGDPEPLGNKRRHGHSFTGRFSNAGSASATITLVNATALYDTP